MSSRFPPQYGELRPISGWDRSGSLRHPSKFQRLSHLGSVTAWQSSSVRQPNFMALNRGHHQCSAGRPSRWALAHVLVHNAQPTSKSTARYVRKISMRQVNALQTGKTNSNSNISLSTGLPLPKWHKFSDFSCCMQEQQREAICKYIGCQWVTFHLQVDQTGVTTIRMPFKCDTQLFFTKLMKK